MLHIRNLEEGVELFKVLGSDIRVNIILLLLKELKDTEGVSYLFVSHDIDVVSMICNRVLFLKDGHITEIEREQGKDANL